MDFSNQKLNTCGAGFLAFDADDEDNVSNYYDFGAHGLAATNSQ